MTRTTHPALVILIARALMPLAACKTESNNRITLSDHVVF
jgi:hypothetical protein